MLEAICQTCGEETRTERTRDATEFVLRHVKRGHRVTKRQVDRDEPAAEERPPGGRQGESVAE